MTPSPAPRQTARHLAAALLALGSLALPAAALAQDQRAQEQRAQEQRAQGQELPPVTESMEVVVVTVEVWVYDKDDIPIRGLTADNFEVLEDGVAVPISHFAEIQESTAPARRLPPMVAPSQPGAPAPPPPAADEPPLLVVYFDHLHLTLSGTRRLVDDLKGLLASGIAPPERVLVLSQGLDLASAASLGSTKKQIDEALTRVTKTPAVARVDVRTSLARLQQLWESAQDRPDPCGVFTLDARAEIAVYAAMAERSSTTTLDNLRRTARMLTALPGPKTLLFVSDAMETRPGVELVRYATNLCGNSIDLSAVSHMGDAVALGKQLQAFADEASRNRITVYPFQASGLQTFATMGPEQSRLETTATSGVDSLLRSVQREGLVELARQTGGWAVFDRNHFGKEFERLGTDMTSYYSLGYSPRQPGVAASHGIEVHLKGELAEYARLRHRLSYRGAEPANAMRDRLEGAIAFGAMRNPLGVRIAAGVLGEANAGRYGMPLHILVPAAEIAFLPQGKGEQANIRVAVLARNAKNGQQVKLEQSFNPLRPPPSSELLDLKMVLELPEGVHVVAVAVRDEVTGESSVVATTVSIHDPAPSASPSGR
ncbi:MAG TPA: VWA domain-containing protein [Thermoanaerobaculia bacterium]|jgi:VWFA-related protein|nr:VWA domain-containing protein [Thermoanaerobaculia bacterium]